MSSLPSPKTGDQRMTDSTAEIKQTTTPAGALPTGAAAAFVERAGEVLPVIGARLAVGEAQATGAESETAAELATLFGTLALAARQDGVDDCASLCTTLSAALAGTSRDSLLDPTSVLSALMTASAGLLAYLHLRVAQVTAAARIVPPDPAARAAIIRLLSGAGLLAAPAASDPQGASLAASVTRGASDLSPTDPDAISPLIVQRFVDDSAEDLQALRRLLLELENPGRDAEALREARHIAHRLKGTAGMLELDRLAQLAIDLEELLVRAPLALESGLGLRRAAVDALLREVALLQVAREMLARGEAVEPALLDASRQLRAALSAPRGTAPRSGAGREPAPGAKDTMGAADGITTQAQGAAADAFGGAVGALHAHNDGQIVLHVEAHELDDLMKRISALAVNRTALLGAREEAAHLQREMDEALRRLSGLSERLLDLQPGGGGGQLPYGTPTAADDLSARLQALRASVLLPQSVLANMPGGALASGSSGRAQESVARERAAEFDHAMRVMRETVEDVSTLEAGLRATIARLQEVAETQEALVGQVQRDVMQLRLVPLQDMLTMVRLAARLTASTLGMEVTFTVQGERTMLDREVGQALAEPLFQLVRNAVAHGIEPPAERTARGKPAGGHLWLVAAHAGSEVTIEVGDDGRGIDPARVLACAQVTGLINAQTAARLSHEQILELAFLPGVSTYGESDLVGGSGVGLDSVRAAIERVRGSVSVASQPSEGTVFRLRVPVSLGMTRVLAARVGEHTYGIPFSSVQRAVRLAQATALMPSVPGASATSGPIRPRCVVRVPRQAPATTDDDVPGYVLAELLGIPWAPDTTRTALIVEATGQSPQPPQRLALLVDEARDDFEVVERALPRHLRRHLVRGASLLPDGQVLLLLDIPELIGRLLSGVARAPRALPTRPAERPAPAATQVLIVDDSISIRHVLAQALSRAGFEVATARDGVDALRAMVRGVPQVIVLDLEMPQMDGFTFLEALRELPEAASTRVIILTSRASEAHRERARALGVADYLVKPCPPELLLAKLRPLVGGTVAGAGGARGNGTQ